MPKQADIRLLVPNCSAQLFWDTVYERPEATERYHKRSVEEVTRDNSDTCHSSMLKGSVLEGVRGQARESNGEGLGGHPSTHPLTRPPFSCPMHDPARPPNPAPRSQLQCGKSYL